MKQVVVFVFAGFFFLHGGAFAVRRPDLAPWGNLEAGPHTPGFRLLKAADPSRPDPSGAMEGRTGRPVRIYLWYPSSGSLEDTLRLRDYVRWAAEDFHPPCQ